MEHACSTENLGLSDNELAGLTGFTLRMVRLLAHAREAWLQADDGNAAAVVAGIRAVMAGHSFKRNERIVRKVLSVGLDSYQRGVLLDACGLLGSPDGGSS